MENGEIYKSIAILAKQYKLSEQKVLDIINTKLVNFLNEGEFALNISNANLYRVLQDGRFKNQFEVKRSSGIYDPEKRRNVEEVYLGVPYELDDVDRPIYGYLTPNIKYENTLYYAYGPASQYTSFDYKGCTCIFDKEKVKKLTTFTIGDSLIGQSYACKCINPKFLGGEFNILKFILNNDNLFTLNHGYYIELQIHGMQKHTINNLKEVVFHDELSKPNDKIKTLLFKNKIPYRVLKNS